MANERTFEPIAVETAKSFAYGEWSVEGGASFKYRWFTPAREEGKYYPLVIFLHGIGERGIDNELHVAANIGAYGYALPENQAKYPCYVLAPQCPEEYKYIDSKFEKSFIPLLKEFIENNAIDRNRIYITGLSMGGIGTWHYISKYPKLFAAAFPICGAGNPYTVSAAKHLPVWTCHAADDPIVPIDGIFNDGMVGTRRMVEALRNCGGDVRMTEYPAGYIAERYPFPPHVAGHAAWEPAYRDEEIRDWLFAQDRSKRDDFELVKPGVWFFNDYSDASYYMIEGRDKALVIDTGMGDHPIMPLIRSITDKPVELAVTHIHGDHMLHADEFDKVYICKAESKALPTTMKAMMPGLKLEEEKICWLEGNEVLDLGGTEVEVITLPGHTPGSLIFADHTHKCLFIGDAIGSGIIVLMSIPHALNISEYKSELEIFAEKAKAFEDYIWLGGHRYQERGSSYANYFAPISEQPMEYNPPHRQLVLDMAELCEKLLAGEIDGEEIVPFIHKDMGEPTYRAFYKSAGIVYLKSQVK
ncbi:MAG: MBL fold metallo-hydrolase [Oscillospiraceae bacterium]|nr:MBL fold metallo-hydrolase [Oscillospiraceae bacterium]